MYRDTTILARHGRHTVLVDALVVAFRCGATLELHAVATTGVPGYFLRAIRIGLRGWGLVDVRALAPTLAREIPQALQRNRDGLIALTLRQVWPTQAGCLAQACRHLVATWNASIEPPPPACRMPIAPAELARLMRAPGVSA